MPKLPRARSGSPVVLDSAVWNLLCDMVERAANFNVSAPLHLSDSGAGRTLYLDLPRIDVSLRIDINAAGDGAYLGWVLGQPSPAPTASDAISDATSGKTPISTDYTALIFNRQERNKATHDLTNGTPICKDWQGYTYGQSTSDGKLICYVNALDVKDCASAPAQGDFAPAEDPSVYHGATATSGVSTVASR
jgi:hypothetical protein